MPAEELKNFGEELKEAREKAEVTLQHIASKTRIDIKFLKAIEEGNFNILPEVYVRAFIKEYAVHCGLEPKETLEKYDLLKSGKTLAKETTPVDDLKTQEEPEKIKKEFSDDIPQPRTKTSNNLNKNKILISVSAVIIFILIVMSYFLFIKNSEPEFVVEKPFEEVLEEQRQRFSIDEKNIPETSESTVDSLTLSFKAIDTCWINITIDEKIDKEFMMYRNTSLVVRAAQKFDIIVGNAGGVSIELNGNPLDFSGNKGERKLFSVNKDGLINPSN
ncbi:MAG TPA: DUF4115 domain-containing protein [Ignavibacteria bacterium]|nr:DUF4115 domain-containing protein [Ignavibacteria bacterium]